MPLYTWGANSYGQLGTGASEDIWTPTKVECFPYSRISSLAAGGGHSIVISDGTISVCGNNSKGQIGLDPSSKSFLSFTEIHHAELTSPASSAACGWEHSLIVTSSSQVYGLGCNGYGQLTSSCRLPATSKPVLIQELDDIVMVSCGLRNSMALSRTGRLFSWGDNRKGQLGRPGDQGSPMPVDGIKEPIRNIAAGQHHGVALGESGTVYTWGCNKHGQLGVDPSKIASSKNPIPVPSLPKNVTSITSGWSHVVACTDDGQLFSWGRSHYGQLGTDCVKGDYGPKRIGDFQCAVQDSQAILTSGSEHNLAADKRDGLLWSWGWNEHGMCGLGHGKDIIYYPSLIEVPVNSGVIEKIACGSGHSLAFTV